MSDTYNPADYKVSEVLAHLEEVDDEERRRIHAAESVGKARSGILSAVALPADCGRPVYTDEGLCRTPTQMTIAHNKQKLAEQVEAMSDEDRAEFERRRARRRTADGSPSTPVPAEPATDEAATAEQES
jgi:hypothetical protein